MTKIITPADRCCFFGDDDDMLIDVRVFVKAVVVSCSKSRKSSLNPLRNLLTIGLDIFLIKVTVLRREKQLTEPPIHHIAFNAVFNQLFNCQ
jgi:hypothetical protein